MTCSQKTHTQPSLEGSAEELNRKQRQAPAARMRPYAVAEMHEWRERNTGKIYRLTFGEMAQREGVGYTTVKGWVDGYERRTNLVLTSKASRSALKRWEGSRKYDWLGKLGKTVDGDFLGWLLSKPVNCGSGKAIQEAGKRQNRAMDKIVVIMAKYQSGVGRYHTGIGTKALSKEYGVSQSTLMTMLRDGGINTSSRANHERTPGKCFRQTHKEGHKRNAENPSLRLKKRVQSRIWCAMKRQSVNAIGSFKHTGCSPDFLRVHIESLWQDGMTWDNYGQWHVDHIRPCASFDLSEPGKMSECFNWKNLQPLWAVDNLSKGAKYAAPVAA